MTDAAKHGMVGPDGQVVFVLLPERLRVMKEMLLTVFRGYAQAAGYLRIEPPATRLDIFVRDQCHRRRMVSGVIHQEYRVKDLHRPVGIYSERYLGQCAQIVVDKFAQ